MFALEDSGLILSAEGPLGVLFGVHDPGDTGMRLGVLVHFRGLQLEMKERKSALGHRASGSPRLGQNKWALNAWRGCCSAPKCRVQGSSSHCGGI